ncbi:hypothetical protein GIB67_002365 [Kingdonia uniflora]|uniref:Uncharacterized protein n=1 Tax=Kingdonia uniflora TaxID=39325 RepID=A0A7J7M8B4_9MAGN|nr:hypothetical protein GIB67_002365 [Kingdonia uniflora]
MHSKNPKPSSKFVASTSSEESSSSDRTMDDYVVIGTVTADDPAASSGRDVGLHAENESGLFFKYPENVDVAKKFLQYKKSLGGEWGNYVMNAGLWFRTLVRPSGNVEHYQVPSLDRWKKTMDIEDDIDIAYYNGTGAEVVEDGFLCYLNQVVYGLSIPLTFFQKGVMNTLKSCLGQLNGNIFEMMRVCEALNKRWRDSGIARQFVADDVLKYYKFKYVKDRKSVYLFNDSARPKFFDFESSRRPWCDHLVMFASVLAKPNPKAAADTSSLFDVVSLEGNKLNKVLGELGIRREKRLNSVVEKIPPVGTERVDADVNMAPPLKKQKKESGKDIRASSKGVNLEALSVTWKSVAEVLKLAAANRGELVRQHDAEKREQFEKEKALQQDKYEKEAAATNKEDVDLALAGKYGEIAFPGDDTFLVAEQTPTPPVADDPTKEEVVHLRGKVIEMEKALSRVRDFINRTQQVHNKLEYERRLHKSNFDKTFKKLFELQCRYGKIKIERDEVLRKETDRFVLLQKSLLNKRFVDESDKLECQRSLLSLTLYFEAEVDSERGLKEIYLELLIERGIVLDPARVKFLVQEAHNRHSREGQRAMRILFFNIKKEDRKIHAQLEIDLRHACDELERCKGHNACLEREKVEYARLLKSSEKGVTLLEARLLDSKQRLQVSQSRLKKKITPKWGKRAIDTDHERQMADVIAFYGGELERVENEFRRYISSCGKDVEVENDKAENINEYLLICDLFFWVEDKEQDKLAALSASNKKLSAKLQQCSLAVERTSLLNLKLESKMLELQSRLNAVTVELSCKDAEILTANNESELWKESLKKKKLETMVANQQRLKKLNWDLREARDSCQRKNGLAKTHEKACSKRDGELNEAINKCNSRIADLDRDKQALVHECIQGNEVFEELDAKYKESQRMMDAVEAEINYSREVDKKLHRLKQEMECSVQITKQYRGSLLQEKKSLEARCKDLDDELNKVKTEFYEAMLLTAENVTLRTMAMLYADVEKFRTERESILAATIEYVTEYDLQLARLSYIDNLMPRVMELLNVPSTVVDVAIPFPVLLSSGPGESWNVVRPKREQ